MLNFSLTIKKCGNERGVSQYHLQLAALLRFVAQPPPLGCVLHDAPSLRAGRALFFILTSFTAVTGIQAQQADAPSAAVQPGQPKAEVTQAAPADSPPQSDHSATPDPKSAETPAASKPAQLPPLHVNGGPSDDILRSARDAGFKIKLVNGTTHFCMTEVPVGTHFASESCLNEQQVTLYLIRVQTQKDKIKTMLGAPSVTH
jgi:hypothetical protein